MNTCRVCKQTAEPLFKYGVRHYAHVKCGLAKWGVNFFDMLPEHQLRNLPYLPIVDAGLVEQYTARLAKVQA